MLKYIFVFAMGIFLQQGIVAQNQIPDGDFENWAFDPFNVYENPASGWWSTLNPLASLGGPVSVSKDGSSHSGTYCALLETYQYGTLLVPGILLSGTFDILASPNFFTRGRPYTDRPSTFEGWYKYNPAMGDSGAIAVQLTKWNTTTLQRDTVGEVGIVITQAAPTWTQFVLPILYFNQDTPDTLVVVATSSAAADQLIGQVGSQLWIDDFDLDITTTASTPTIEKLDITFVPGEDWAFQVGNSPIDLQVINASGQPVLRRNLRPGNHRFATDSWSEGLYLVHMKDQKGHSLVRKVILTR